ncbi:MAG: DUF4960 domain-containing protein [Muribaculaceae bacterium]|nr:DUF4960 domain-containing protein [Muribaculaceae bacterium]
MKYLSSSLYIALLWVLAISAASCSDSNTSNLALEGDTRIEAITVSGYEGVIDHTAKAIAVNVATDVDLTNLTVDAITLSSGARCDYPAGTKFNGTMPRAIHVVNGDVYADYTVSVKHDNVEFLTFTINGSYSGSIDNDARTILVFVPINEDISSMQATFTVNEGTEVSPASGSVHDFSEPVVFTATQRTATVDYTVTVVKDEMSQEPKAFVGNAASAAQLGSEAKAACDWMLNNVPNSRYVAIQDVIDGNVKLDDFKMIWCHFDWLDWPGQLWDSRDMFNSYWLHGGAILASRDGARYINDVWRIARDQQSPNNMFGGESFETLTDDLGFVITGHEDHALYEGLPSDADNRIILLAAGCSNTNRTLQWGVDWNPYGSMEGWEERTGAKALASGHDYDINRVTIAEFEPYEALKGFTSGKVITIGTPAYEWYDKNNADNPYRENIVKLTKNAINYLCQ